MASATTIETGDFIKLDNRGDGEYGLFISNQADPTSTSHLTLIGTADSAVADSGTLTNTFDYTTGTGSVILGNISSGSKVTSVTVTVNTAFDGTSPTLTVGDSGDSDRLMTADDNDLEDAFAYETNPNHVYTNTVDTQVSAFLTVNSATQGNVTVTVSYQYTYRFLIQLP